MEPEREENRPTEEVSSNLSHALDRIARLHEFEQKVEIIWLLGLFGYSIRPMDPTPTTAKNNLVALFPHA